MSIKSQNSSEDLNSSEYEYTEGYTFSKNNLSHPVRSTLDDHIYEEIKLEDTIYYKTKMKRQNGFLGRLPLFNKLVSKPVQKPNFSFNDTPLVRRRQPKPTQINNSQSLNLHFNKYNVGIYGALNKRISRSLDCIDLSSLNSHDITQKKSRCITPRLGRKKKIPINLDYSKNLTRKEGLLVSEEPEINLVKYTQLKLPIKESKNTSQPLLRRKNDMELVDTYSKPLDILLNKNDYDYFVPYDSKPPPIIKSSIKRLQERGKDLIIPEENEESLKTPGITKKVLYSKKSNPIKEDVIISSLVKKRNLIMHQGVQRKISNDSKMSVRGCRLSMSMEDLNLSASSYDEPIFLPFIPNFKNERQEKLKEMPLEVDELRNVTERKSSICRQKILTRDKEFLKSRIKIRAKEEMSRKSSDSSSSEGSLDSYL